MATISKTALVTGGAGFIGHHLVRGLIQRGYRVRVIDDLSRGDRRRLDGLSEIEFVEASVLDRALLATAVKGVDVIFHEAALASVPQSVEMPLEYHQADATGTLCVLEAARQAGVKRVVYAASSSAYGEQPELPKRENMPADPISPYAVAKYAGELYMSVYARIHAMQTVCLRYFNVFGPHQDPKSQYGAAIPAIVTRMLRGERPTIYGDGEQTRDFCYVENVVAANVLAGEAPDIGGAVLNIACGQKVTVNQIVSRTNEILGMHLEPIHAEPRVGDVRDSWADISLARKAIGYQPTVFFDEGLARSIEWYRAAGRK
jgi:UDP-glucose 4-epimerase